MNIWRLRDSRSALAVLALTLSLGLVAGTGPAVTAQEGTPDVPEAATTPYPVTIHLGTCDEFDPQPAHVLEDAAPREGERRGSSAAIPVASTTMTIDAGFDDLLAEQPHVLLVLPSQEEFGPPVACGDLGGIVVDDTLVMALRPTGESGLAGLAILTEQAGLLQFGDEEIDIAIHVFAVEEPEVPATGTPEPVAAAGEDFAHPEWLVDPAWLEQNLDQPNVRVLGVQGDDPTGQGAVPGASQFGPVGLPGDTSEEALQLWREQVSIQLGSIQRGAIDGEWSPGDTIVLYDGGTMEATVLWWILDYVGHEDKRLLNGGWQAWAEYQGIPQADALAPPIAPGGVADPLTPFPGEFREDVLSTLDEMTTTLEDEQVLLIDTRSSEAYDAGHLPGAVNVPATDNFVEGSPYWRDAASLHELYAAAGVTPEARIITYGDAGPGAAMAYVTLRVLGYDDVSLYPGGWDEWSRYPDLPRVKDEAANDS